MFYGIVYRITNLETGQCYIGRTKNTLRYRWNNHCRGSSNCVFLKNAINKYGKESFSIEAIASSWDADNLKALEMLLIQQENTLVPNGYNLINTGCGISQVSEVTREKLSSASKGKLKTEEHRRKISEGRKGIIFSDEHRKNISLSQKGRIGSPSTGTVMSEEAKQHLRDINKGKTLSQETRAKISDARKGKFGRPHTLEARIKMSEARKGKALSEEHRRNIALAHRLRRDKVRTPKTIAREISGK